MAEYVLGEITKRNGLLRAKNRQKIVKSHDRLRPEKEIITFDCVFVFFLRAEIFRIFAENLHSFIFNSTSQSHKGFHFFFFFSYW